METIYDKLVQLQTLPHAYEEWQSYRYTLTQWILSQTKSQTSALIIGAGACNDYDLKSLSSHFSTLYLLDLDAKTLEKGIQKQFFEISQPDHLEIIEGDILGISPLVYRQFCNRLQTLIKIYGRDIDFDVLTQTALEEMEIAYAQRNPDDYLLKPKSVDYILMCGVHSQLNSMFPWIFETYSQALGKRSLAVHQKAKEFNNILIPSLHQNLFAAARKGLLLGLEKSRVGIDGGVEGAYQGILDIERRVLENPDLLIKREALLWPFHKKEQIFYQMELFSLRGAEPL